MTLRSRSLRIAPELCRGHMACMRHCPTQAIRVWQRGARLIPGRCIDCGACLRVCPAGAITTRLDSFTDFGRFRRTVAIPSPTLFSQFGLQKNPAAIIRALQRAGFDEVVDISPAIEAVLLEIRKLADQRERQRPLISPFCPAVVRLIQARYPDLAELLAPVEAPQELLAAAVRERAARFHGLRRDQVGVIYITPCASKMVGLRLHTRLEPSNIDGAVAVSHIYGHLRAAMESDNGSEERGTDGPSGAALQWALLGGQGAAMTDNSLVVAGLDNVSRIFEDIETGRLCDLDYIECRSCREGCIDGCLMIDNPYEARSKLLRIIRSRGACIEADRPEVRELAGRSDVKAKPLARRPQPSLDPEMSRSLEKMRRLEELHTRLPRIDCGACGSPTCRAFAEDVVQGRLEEDDCVFLLQGRLRHTVRELGGILDKLPQATRNGTETKI